MSDRVDGSGTAWFASTAQPGDVCLHCGESPRRGARVFAERLEAGEPGRPRVLHRKCWPGHERRMVRVLDALKLADKVF